MSQENVDTVSRGFGLWHTAMGDGTRQHAGGADRDHPDVAFDFSRTDFPVTRSREAMATWVEHAREMVLSLRKQATEFIGAGDAVVVAAAITGRGATSGAEVAMEFSYVFRFKPRQIASSTTYLARREALNVVGLEE